MSLFDDDGGFNKPKKGKGSLGGLFDDDEPVSGGNSSLTYTAPKAPKQTTPTPTPTSQSIINETPTPKSNGASSGDTTVQLFKFNSTTNEHAPVGKAKISVRSNQLLVYTKTETVVQMALSSKFKFTVQNNVYGSFYDDATQNWSMLFKSEESIAEFAARLLAAQLPLARGTTVSLDLVVGTMGRLPIDNGDMLGVVYTGYLLEDGERGAVFDSNRGQSGTLRVRMGQGDVIVGLEQGMVGMKKGGRRLLAIPAALAYGDAGLPGKVPPGASLLFDVQVTKLKSRANNTAAAAPTAAPASEPRRARSDTADAEAAEKAALVARMARLGQSAVPGAAAPVAQQQQQQQQQAYPQQQQQQQLAPYQPQQQQPYYQPPPPHYYQQQQAPQPIIVNTTPAAAPQPTPSANTPAAKTESDVQEMVESRQFRQIASAQLTQMSAAVTTMESKLSRAIILQGDEHSTLSPAVLLQSITRVVNDAERANSEIEKKTTLISELRAKIASLHEQNERFIDEKAALLEAKNATLNNASDLSRKQLEALHNEKTALATELADASVALSSARTQAAARERQLAALTTERDEAAAEAARLAKRVLELTPSQEEAEKRENELRARLSAQTAAREQAESAVTAMAAERDTAFASLARARDDAREAATRAEQRLSDVESEAKERVAALQAQLDKADAKARQSVAEAKAEQQAAVARLEAALEASEKKLKDAEKAAKKAQKEAKAARKEAASAAASGANAADVDEAVADALARERAETSSAIKKVMSSVYFAAAADIDEEGEFRGDEVLGKVMKAIKRETLLAVQRMKRGEGLAPPSDDEAEEEEEAAPVKQAESVPVQAEAKEEVDEAEPVEEQHEEEETEAEEQIPEETKDVVADTDDNDNDNDDDVQPVVEKEEAVVEAEEAAAEEEEEEVKQVEEQPQEEKEEEKDEKQEEEEKPEEEKTVDPLADTNPLTDNNDEDSEVNGDAESVTVVEPIANPLADAGKDDDSDWDDDDDEQQKQQEQTLPAPEPKEETPVVSETKPDALNTTAASELNGAADEDDDDDDAVAPATKVEATPESSPLDVASVTADEPKPVAKQTTPNKASAGVDDLFSTPASASKGAADSLDDLFGNSDSGLFGAPAGVDDLFSPSPITKSKSPLAVLSAKEKQEAKQKKKPEKKESTNSGGAMSFLDGFGGDDLDTGLFGD